MKDSPYFAQCQWLLRVLAHVRLERCFALKGGTAINFFVRDVPRLSVDIDLTYVPTDSRETALANISAALERVAVAVTGKLSDVAALALSPALAFGLQGASQNYQTFEVTFTKWITGVTPSGTLLMAGFTGGDAVGDFAGEVLDRKVSTDGRITLLQPIYEVRSGNRSFTALILGGMNSTGLGQLDGVIQEGWRTGARVHVEFQRMTDCYGAPPGACFRGTIRILPDSQP